MKHRNIRAFYAKANCFLEISSLVLRILQSPGLMSGQEPGDCLYDYMPFSRIWL